MTQRRPVNYVLKPAVIDNAKPHATAHGLTDGGGLYIEVLPSGSKVWRYKYHRLCQREKVTIGPYPSIGIKAARDRHEVLREQLHGGDSPGQTTRPGGTARGGGQSR